MKNLSDYLDSFKMLVTKFDRDGGDSCAHGCAILYSTIVLYDLDTAAQLVPYASRIEVANGLYCRHPDTTKWYSRNNTFSRDQLTPLIAYLSVSGPKAALRRLFKAHLKRLLLFAWNTRRVDSYPDEHTGVSYAWKIPDVTGPDIIGMYIRGFGTWILYPALLLCDIPTLLASIIYRTGLSASTIQMNHVIMVDFSTRIMPTPISWLAKKIYGKETPKAALKASWSPEWQPPVDEYLSKLIESCW